MPKGEEHSGNSVMSQLSLDRIVNKRGAALMKVDGLFDGQSQGNVHPTEMRIRAPSTSGGEFLVVIKAVVDGVEAIAFHSGDGFSEALTGACNRLRNGSLKWKEDRPYDERRRS